jgi:hypothetical protein
VAVCVAARGIPVAARAGGRTASCDWAVWLGSGGDLIMSDCKSGDSWRLANAVVRGTSHEATGLPCQDYVQLDQFDLADGSGRVLVVALADGAGSAPRSAEGAKRACDEVVLSVKGDEPRLRRAEGAEVAVWAAFERARRQIDELAATEGVPVRDFASTLLVAVVAPWGAVFGQLGDGAIAFGASKELELAFQVEQEMVNVTDFLTDGDAERKTRVRSVTGPIRRLAVSSDGLTGLLIDQKLRRPHPPAFDMLFAPFAGEMPDGDICDKLRELLGSQVVNARTDDDKSLLLALRPEAV